MPSFTPRFIATAEKLRSVSPSLLRRFLNVHPAFFRPKKIISKTARAIDYAKLAAALKHPGDDMSVELMSDLLYWDEVAEMAQIEEVIELAKAHSISLPEDVTIESAVLQLRLDIPREVEELHSTCRAVDLLRRKKRFLLYHSISSRIPKWKKPHQRKLDQFAAEMERWNFDHKKGRGTRLICVPYDGAIWFIVRHGKAYERISTVERDGGGKEVFVRPETHDLLIYRPARGELEIYNAGNSVAERRAYCTYLGKIFFGDPNFFEKDDLPKYTLAPLRERGAAALGCGEIPGLRSASLALLRYRFGGQNKHFVTHTARNVFSGLQSLGESIPEKAELVAMGVKLLTADGIGGERLVKLYSPNVAVYDHESDAELAHQFLSQGGFIIQRNGKRKDD